MRQRTGGLGLGDLLQPSSEMYDEKYWDRERGQRSLRPEQERFLDTARLDKVQAKFDPTNYDHGQFRYKRKELYCESCDVWVRSRDQMQAHREGANHKKKSSRVAVFECQLCLIKVPCQDTLNSHMRGKDHIKRVNQLTEARRKARAEAGQQQQQEEEEELGYKTGPLEMMKLRDDEREELGRLRRENEILRTKVGRYVREREQTRRELEELRREVRRCRDNTQVSLKRETEETNRPSTSQVKREPGLKAEYFEHGDEDIDIDLT